MILEGISRYWAHCPMNFWPYCTSSTSSKYTNFYYWTNSTHQHWCHSNIPLLSSGHACTSLICFIDCAHNQNIEYHHNDARNDTHENEIGDENVVLNVLGIRSQACLFSQGVGPVHQVMVVCQIGRFKIKGLGDVGKGRFFGDPLDSELEKAGNIVNDTE